MTPFTTQDSKNPQSYSIQVVNTGSSTSQAPLISVAYSTEPKDPQEVITTHWNDLCQADSRLINSGYCRLDKQVCTDSNTTKTIDGVNVTEPCWSKQYHYRCGGSGQGTCQTLAQQGCQQISSQCSDQENGMCLSFQETW